MSWNCLKYCSSFSFILSSTLNNFSGTLNFFFACCGVMVDLLLRRCWFPPPLVVKISPIFCSCAFGFPPPLVVEISPIFYSCGFGFPPPLVTENTCDSNFVVLLWCYSAIHLEWEVSILRHVYCTTIPIRFPNSWIDTVAENTCVSIFFVLPQCFSEIRLEWEVRILRHVYCTTIPDLFRIL